MTETTTITEQSETTNTPATQCAEDALVNDSVLSSAEPWCACGRRVSQCDRSRAACGKTGRVAAYYERQDAKKDRLTARAAKVRGQAASALATERRISDAIPLGQPILVGHHSEKRHRRDIERMDALFRRHIELSDKAADLERRANAVGASGAISSDNPEALDLLRAKVEALKAKREIEKHCNAALKKAHAAWQKAHPTEGADARRGTPPEVMLGFIADLNAPDWAKRRLADYVHAFPWLPQFDNGTQTEIRRCEARIADLERRAAETPRPDRSGEGWTISENREDNRVEIHFSARQSRAIVDTLKGWGFRWTPSKTAWQRMLNNVGRHAADMVIAAVERERAASQHIHQ